MAEEPLDLVRLNNLFARSDSGYEGEEAAALGAVVSYLKQHGKRVRDLQLIVGGQGTAEAYYKEQYEREVRELHADNRLRFPDRLTLRRHLDEAERTIQTLKAALRDKEAIIKEKDITLAAADKLVSEVTELRAKVPELRSGLHEADKLIKQKERELSKAEATEIKLEAEIAALKQDRRDMQQRLRDKDKELLDKIDKHFRVQLMREHILAQAGPYFDHPMPESEFLTILATSYPGVTVDEFIERLGFDKMPSPIPPWLRIVLRGMREAPPPPPKKKRNRPPKAIRDREHVNEEGLTESKS